MGLTNSENWKVVQVRLRDGSRVRIVAESVIGAFAIHRRLRDRQAQGEGFTVTHVESGWSVWHTQTELEAECCATALAGYGDKVFQLTQQEHAAMQAMLAKVAPLFIPRNAVEYEMIRSSS